MVGDVAGLVDRVAKRAGTRSGVEAEMSPTVAIRACRREAGPGKKGCSHGGRDEENVAHVNPVAGSACGMRNGKGIVKLRRDSTKDHTPQHA